MGCKHASNRLSFSKMMILTVGYIAYLLFSFISTGILGFVASSKASIILRYQIKEEVASGSMIGDVLEELKLHRNYSKEIKKQLELIVMLEKVPFIALRNGKLYVEGRLDRESPLMECRSKIKCEVHIDVGVKPTRFFEIIQVIIDVADINDHTPFFKQSTKYISIIESAQVSTIYTLPQAFDPDSPIHGVQRYALKPQNKYFKQVIDTKMDGTLEPKLMLIRGLDREKKDIHHLELIACEPSAAPQCAFLQVLVQVLDFNDNKPTFDKPAYFVNVSEDTQLGSVILQVTATDMDIKENSEIEYSLVDTSERFYTRYIDLDSVTGQLIVSKKLDRETKPAIELLVMAKDNGIESLFSEVAITIFITDVNDNPPSITVTNIFSTSINQNLKGFKNYKHIKNIIKSNVFSHIENKITNKKTTAVNNGITIEKAQAIKVDENTPLQTFIAHVRVHDADLAENSRVDCWIDNHHNFKLIEMSADHHRSNVEYQIVTNQMFDVESMLANDRSIVFNISITCSDNPRKIGDKLLSESTFYVMLTDINDCVPQIIKAFYIVDTTFDDVRVNEPIIKIEARDDDATFKNSQYHYSIVENDLENIDNVQGIFHIEPLSGDMTLELSNNSMHSNVSFYLFEDSSLTENISMNQDDVSEYNENINLKNANKNFVDINLMIFKYLNFVCIPLNVSDHGVPSLFSIKHIYIHFNKINNSTDEIVKETNIKNDFKVNFQNEIVFSSNLYIFKVKEKAFNLSKPIGKISVQGESNACFDRKPLVDITFRMINDHSSPFSINKKSGFVYSKRILDREKKSNHMLLVEVSSQKKLKDELINIETFSEKNLFEKTKTKQITKTIPVLVMVLDENDNAPYFSQVIVYNNTTTNITHTSFPVRKSVLNSKNFHSTVLIPPYISLHLPILKLIALDKDIEYNSRISLDLLYTSIDFLDDSKNNGKDANNSTFLKSKNNHYEDPQHLFKALKQIFSPVFFIESKTGNLFIKWRKKEKKIEKVDISISSDSIITKSIQSFELNHINEKGLDYSKNEDYKKEMENNNITINMNNTYTNKELSLYLIKNIFKNPIRLKITAKDHGNEPKESTMHLTLVLNTTNHIKAFLEKEFWMNNLTQTEKEWLEHYELWPSLQKKVAKGEDSLSNNLSNYTTLIFGFETVNFVSIICLIGFLIILCFTILLITFLKGYCNSKKKTLKVEHDFSTDQREVSIFKSSINKKHMYREARVDNFCFCSLKSAIKPNYDDHDHEKQNVHTENNIQMENCALMNNSPSYRQSKPYLSPLPFNHASNNSLNNALNNVSNNYNTVYNNHYICNPQHINTSNQQFSTNLKTDSINMSSNNQTTNRTVSLVDYEGSVSSKIYGDLNELEGHTLESCRLSEQNPRFHSLTLSRPNLKNKSTCQQHKPPLHNQLSQQELEENRFCSLDCFKESDSDKKVSVPVFFCIFL